jgi:uncharacterized protein YdiU (UPF0061 family)
MLRQIPSNPKLVHFSEEVGTPGISIETQNQWIHKHFQERTITPFPSVFDELRRTSIWNWAGQLGDGRAILAEIENKEQVYTLQLKVTYSQSRWFSILRSSIRAFVQRSHVSSRRSHYPILSLILTETRYYVTCVRRKPRIWKGAVVCRVAPSFIRFGNFELFSSQSDLATLKTLADFTIKYHFPEIKETDAANYVQLFNP